MMGERGGESIRVDSNVDRYWEQGNSTQRRKGAKTQRRIIESSPTSGDFFTGGISHLPHTARLRAFI